MTQNILLYGNSIFLNGLAVWLQTQSDLTVRRQSPGDTQRLPDNPATVIVDVHETPVPETLALFSDRPNLTLIGVDDRLNTATVLHGQVYHLQTFGDVLHCLK